jgi:hypothetical protein
MRSILLNLAIVLLFSLGALHAPPASADEIEVREARLEQGEDALLLSVDFQFDFNPRLEQLVANGVPLYFVVEFELTRPRWYWFDEKAATRRLQMRLSYHALTRHYRLSTGLLQQNFASLADALAVLRRVRNWPVLERAAASPDSSYQAAVRMRLDIALLPKPFQVSALTSREWHLESDWRRFTFRVPATQPAPAAPADRRDDRREDRREEKRDEAVTK